MSAIKERFMDMINYRYFVEEVEANFGYDGDCDDGQMIDATDYDGEIEHWLDGIDITKGSGEYEFLFQAIYAITHDWPQNNTGHSEDERVNQFLKDYKEFRKDSSWCPVA